jgi:hypothetical protein
MLAKMLQSALSIEFIGIPNFTSDTAAIQWANNHIDYSKDYIIHVHSKFITNAVDPTKTILIQSKRHNLLNAILSEQIATRTTQWNSYTPLTPAPFTVSKSQFHRRLQRLTSWYDDIDTTKPWHSEVELYYEDLVKHGHSIVAETLGMTSYDITAPITGKQSLHTYHDWIINLEELTDFYNSLNTPAV